MPSDSMNRSYGVFGRPNSPKPARLIPVGSCQCVLPVNSCMGRLLFRGENGSWMNALLPMCRARQGPQLKLAPVGWVELLRDPTMKAAAWGCWVSREERLTQPTEGYRRRKATTGRAFGPRIDPLGSLEELA